MAVAWRWNNSQEEVKLLTTNHKQQARWQPRSICNDDEKNKGFFWSKRLDRHRDKDQERAKPSKPTRAKPINTISYQNRQAQRTIIPVSNREPHDLPSGEWNWWTMATISRKKSESEGENWERRARRGRETLTKESNPCKDYHRSNNRETLNWRLNNETLKRIYR